MKTVQLARIALGITVGLGFALDAQAYVGPGAGISVLGALIGLVSAIFLSLWAVLRWPFRRMMARRRAAQAAAGGTASVTNHETSR